MQATSVQIAACKYPLETLSNCAEFLCKQTTLLQEAKSLGAEIVVFPEYFCLEMASWQPDSVRGDFAASFAALQEAWPHWQQWYQGFARQFKLWICAGTFLLATGDGRYLNRALLVSPEGKIFWQDKLQLTGFEKNSQIIVPGKELKVWETSGLHTGIAVCYDCEFPLQVRAQREAGAQLLLVPSCTDTAAGASRVRTGCLARALENRMLVACATTAGALPWSPALDTNTGEAAIILPMDIGLPADGLAAQTQGSEHWATARIDIATLNNPFAQVAIDRDWPGQITQAKVENQ